LCCTIAFTEAWRQELKVGSLIDCLDTVHKWYTGSVVEVKGEIVKMTFEGWSNRYDEWISRSSERIASYKSIATGGKESNGIIVNALLFRAHSLC
jgi:predicted amino acid dehydrogenase